VAKNLTVKQAVTAEVESVDFYWGVLAGVNEPDIAVRNHGLNLETTVGRLGHNCRTLSHL
jgi:hypothetical protein